MGAFSFLGLLSNFILYAVRKSFDTTYRQVEDIYKKGKAFEESWCDMFAGIYNFPVVFYIKSMTDKNKNFTPNTVGNVEKLNELARLEKEIHTLLFPPLTISNFSFFRVHFTAK